MTYDNIISKKKIRDDYFEMHAFLKEQISKASPNPSHLLFTELQNQGKLLKLVTQNIDRLHKSAGVSEDKLLEIHGNSEGIICTKCKTMQPNPEKTYNAVKECVYKGEEIPEALTTCCHEHCGGVLKPNTISFGEPLVEEVLVEARQMCRECDLLIVMGTRLLVRPVNQFPKLVARRNVPVVIINMEGKFSELIH